MGSASMAEPDLECAAAAKAVPLNGFHERKKFDPILLDGRQIFLARTIIRMPAAIRRKARIIDNPIKGRRVERHN